jgi:hypothetical protein
MPITESRVKSGTLTFGGEGGGTAGTGTVFACQATTVKVTPSYAADGDAVETLCGDQIPEGKKTTWTLNGTSIQDFDDPEGFLAYCFTNSLTTVAFEWAPNITGAPTWSGDCVIKALEEGGDVNKRITTDWEFDIVGTPTRTPFAGGATTQAEPDATVPPANGGKREKVPA